MEKMRKITEKHPGGGIDRKRKKRYPNKVQNQICFDIRRTSAWLAEQVHDEGEKKNEQTKWIGSGKRRRNQRSFSLHRPSLSGHGI